MEIKTGTLTMAYLLIGLPHPKYLNSARDLVQACLHQISPYLHRTVESCELTVMHLPVLVRSF